MKNLNLINRTNPFESLLIRRRLLDTAALVSSNFFILSN